MWYNTSVWIKLAAFALPLIFIESCSSDNKLKTENAEALIRVNRLMNNVIIVSLGSDAVTAINTEEGIVIIDAGISNSLTSEYRRIIEKEFQKKDFAYLINTHSHWDHTGGNQVFSDAVIIGQENCVYEIKNYWKDKERIKNDLKKAIENYDAKLMNIDPDWQDSLDIYCKKLKYQSVLNDLPNDRIVTLPKQTFKDSMDINIGGITLRLIYFGRLHSGSDILISIPELDLLFAGDLFSSAAENSFVSSDITESRRRIIVKKWIDRRLDHIRKIVRGHGEIINSQNVDSFIRHLISF